MMFATEHVLMCLDDLAKDTTDPNIQLDEVEIQKGFLQLARSLDFLHESNRVHTNLNGKSVLVNAKGDWKLAGCGFLKNLDETESRHSNALEDLEDDLPELMKRNLDYVDPSFAFDCVLEPANDMFSLGVLLFMTLHHGSTPYYTHGSMNALRKNAEQIPSKLRTAQWSSLGADVQGLLQPLDTDILENLVSKHGTRYTAKEFQKLPYFNNVIVSSLKFLERDSFAGCVRSEKIQFLRGLPKVLPQFSKNMLRRKLLPCVRIWF